MKTQLSISILTASCMSLLCGACGTSEDLSVPVAAKDHAPVGAERALSAATSAEKPHCVVAATAVAKGSTASLAAVPAEPAPATCFATFAEAATFATRGAVQFPADTRPGDIRPDQLSTFSSPYVIALEYANNGFSGRSLHVTSEVDCRTSSIYLEKMPVEYVFGLPIFDWDNKISSAQAFGGCNHSYHYEDISFGGAGVDCQNGCNYIGDALNNRTSSIQWTE